MSATQPENVDNPATPDVDVDASGQPLDPQDPGAFQYQEPDPNAEDGAESPLAGGEPVIQPQGPEVAGTDETLQPQGIENSGTDEAVIVPNDEQPDASQQDNLVEPTDNSGEPGMEDAPQDPDAVPESDLTEDAEPAEDQSA